MKLNKRMGDPAVLEPLPGKQGLKLKFFTNTSSKHWVLEPLPGKQGLKPEFVITKRVCHISVLEPLPEKQGLKHFELSKSIENANLY